MFQEIINNVREKLPLVHNITNYVTVNDCANIVLACGGAPIMADDIGEVEQITSICTSLVINIGTLNERTIKSMFAAGKKANELSHPTVLDPVGAGASTLRTNTALSLVKEVKFSVIRGNISEIKCIANEAAKTKGVEADEGDLVGSDNLDETVALAKRLSAQTEAVIAITGPIDIVANSQKAYIIKNGHPMMSKITGAGCMLSSLIGAFCGANSENLLAATAAAVCAMGICGEIAYEKAVQSGGGTSSFRMHLIDAMSNLDAATLGGGAKIEIR
ncbi:MAG: hydroxyethylthiazole kinase [Eubacteriales bacterium]|jgi:hydroxyethylthiazole kinase|nr:hydroxyethylthiazole kinase [Eubacteriales bacterium]